MIDVKLIDAILPQTQCGECGYPGCMPYAEAIAAGSAQIDQCPPGGERVVLALAALLKRDPADAIEKARQQYRPPSVAQIREPECIGCTKCIQACPVDAIIGAAKQMHVVILHECTGCGLCVPACPVDCIDVHPLPEPVYDPALARKRFLAKHVRHIQDNNAKQRIYREKRALAQEKTVDLAAKQDYIAALLARKK